MELWKYIEVVTDSLKVAEYFGKRHEYVLRRIQDIIEKGIFQEHTFVLVLRDVKQGNGAIQQRPMYQMDKDGFSLLAFGFTGDKAHQFKLEYIRAFNQA